MAANVLRCVSDGLQLQERALLCQSLGRLLRNPRLAAMGLSVGNDMASNCRRDLIRYNALPIYRGLFSPNNSRETPIARSLGRGMGVFREIIVWPMYYLRVQRTVCGIVLYGTAIYRVHSIDLGPLLLTWFNFNRSMDKTYINDKVWDEITYPFPDGAVYYPDL